MTERLRGRAREACGAEPAFTVQLIVLSGILQWNYQAQVFLPPREEGGADVSAGTGAP